LSFYFAQPEERALLSGEPVKCIGNNGGYFRWTWRGILIPPTGCLLPAPPLRCELSSDAEEVSAKASVFRIEASRASPDLRESVLHNIFSRLFTREKMPEEYT